MTGARSSPAGVLKSTHVYNAQNNPVARRLVRRGRTRFYVRYANSLALKAVLMCMKYQTFAIEVRYFRAIVAVLRNVNLAWNPANEDRRAKVDVNRRPILPPDWSGPRHSGAPRRSRPHSPAMPDPRRSASSTGGPGAASSRWPPDAAPGLRSTAPASASAESCGHRRLTSRRSSPPCGLCSGRPSNPEPASRLVRPCPDVPDAPVKSIQSNCPIPGAYSTRVSIFHGEQLRRTATASDLGCGMVLRWNFRVI